MFVLANYKNYRGHVCKAESPQQRSDVQTPQGWYWSSRGDNGSYHKRRGGVSSTGVPKQLKTVDFRIIADMILKGPERAAVAKIDLLQILDTPMKCPKKMYFFVKVAAGLPKKLPPQPSDFLPFEIPRTSALRGVGVGWCQHITPIFSGK